MGTRDDSGALTLSAGVIRYDGPTTGGADGFSIPAADVLLIGELTNDHGPFRDDWFLLFFTSPVSYVQASFYAEGCMETLDALGKHLGHPLLPTLYSSPDWASNALWPAEVDGTPIFTFTDVHARTALGRVWETLTGGPSFNRQALTPEIQAFLERAAGAH